MAVRGLFFRPWQSFAILLAFLVNSLGPIPLAQADDFRLPAPGVMVHLSPPLDPPMLKGIKVHPDNPFRFDFILDKGDVELSNDQLKNESSKLIKYFLASLTIPEKDLWVNLSPYEKDRVIPQSFGLTEMGRDLLAEDYMLKQITASLIYPEDEIGRKFWKRVYEEAAKKYGTTNIPVNTFNKVWIVPEKAVVYENAQAGTAYVVESKLKVMLEQDYLALEKNQTPTRGHVPEGYSEALSPSTLPADSALNMKASQGNSVNALGSQIVREIVVPELTKEVNENKNFAKLRQVYNSLILATWYKMKIRDSILAQVYADKNKVSGVNNDDPKEKDKIYQRYLQAFKKGVYNYIKEEQDPMTQETIPRKYFSGGVKFSFNFAMKSTATSLDMDTPKVEISHNDTMLPEGQNRQDELVTANVNPAMNVTKVFKNTAAAVGAAAVLGSGYLYQKSQEIHLQPVSVINLSTGVSTISDQITERKALMNATKGEHWTDPVEMEECVVVVVIDQNGKMSEAHFFYEDGADLSHQVNNFLGKLSSKPKLVNFFDNHSEISEKLNKAFRAHNIKVSENRVSLAGNHNFYFGIKLENHTWVATGADDMTFGGFGVTHIDFVQDGDRLVIKKDNAMNSIKRILVLDNEELLAMNNADNLKAQGYVVEEAYSLAEARDKIKTATEPFDLVVADIDLGNNEFGWQLAQENPDIPFIIATGRNQPDEHQAIRELAPKGKIVAFLSKPFNSNLLVDAVARADEELKKAHTGKDNQAIKRDTLPEGLANPAMLNTRLGFDSDSLKLSMDGSNEGIKVVANQPINLTFQKENLFIYVSKHVWVDSISTVNILKNLYEKEIGYEVLENGFINNDREGNYFIATRNYGIPVDIKSPSNQENLEKISSLFIKLIENGIYTDFGPKYIKIGRNPEKTNSQDEARLFGLEQFENLQPDNRLVEKYLKMIEYGRNNKDWFRIDPNREIMGRIREYFNIKSLPVNASPIDLLPGHVEDILHDELGFQHHYPRSFALKIGANAQLMYLQSGDMVLNAANFISAGKQISTGKDEYMDSEIGNLTSVTAYCGPCTFMIIYNTTTKATYAVHSNGVDISSLKDKLKQAGTKFANDKDNTIVIFSGNGIFKEDYKQDNLVSEKILEEQIKNRQSLADSTRNFGFKIVEAYSHNTNTAITTSFDPRNGLLNISQQKYGPKGTKVELLDNFLMAVGVANRNDLAMKAFGEQDRALPFADGVVRLIAQMGKKADSRNRLKIVLAGTGPREVDYTIKMIEQAEQDSPKQLFADIEAYSKSAETISKINLELRGRRQGGWTINAEAKDLLDRSNSLGNNDKDVIVSQNSFYLSRGLDSTDDQFRAKQKEFVGKVAQALQSGGLFMIEDSGEENGDLTFIEQAGFTKVDADGLTGNLVFKRNDQVIQAVPDLEVKAAAAVHATNSPEEHKQRLIELSAQMHIDGFNVKNTGIFLQDEMSRTKDDLLEPNYQANNYDVRAEFLLLLDKIKTGKIRGSQDLLKALEKMNQTMILGADRNNPSVPPSMKATYTKETVYQVAGVRRFPDDTKRFQVMYDNLHEFLQSGIQNNNLEVILRHIADFYYSAIHSEYVFMGANNSQFMNMTNTLLRLCGLNGVLHDYLEIAVEHYTEQEFQEIFLVYVNQFNSSNPAMKAVIHQLTLSRVAKNQGPGGIDLTPANMNLQTLNAGQGIKFHMDSAMLAQLQNAPGFVPVIIDIQPMLDLRAFLGVKNKEEPAIAAV
jgi:CheY-like chemotaxis protein